MAGECDVFAVGEHTLYFTTCLPTGASRLRDRSGACSAWPRAGEHRASILLVRRTRTGYVVEAALMLPNRVLTGPGTVVFQSRSGFGEESLA